ncbi:DUF7146 domain-containing protein [Thalassobaculum salexigens]|uniref:DUF7146 domain-containing protein n=1 Tax=Thalassobaculum salexigens TaxID=455360 RepID=UPI001B7FA1BB|nr:toprim domain-containing protein [Thalassobaculum salexigens]
MSLTDADDGRLLMYCHAGCSFTEVVDALRRKGLIEHRRSNTRVSSAEARRHRAVETDAMKKRSRMAWKLWNAASPIAGTLGETYLNGRGIDCTLPDTLRYMDSCWHRDSQSLPAIVARVDGGDGFAIQRTYLTPDGTAKADHVEAKLSLGCMRGGAVRLCSGFTRLVVAEGIETALSLRCGLLDLPASIWAALGASGLRNLRLPQTPGELIVAIDGDPTGWNAGRELARRAYAIGWSVSLLPAPNGTDWNDVLRGKAVAA